MAPYVILSVIIALLTPVGATTPNVPALVRPPTPFEVPTGEKPLPTLSISDIMIDEDGSRATFTITRVGKTKKKVKVDVATSDLEATAGADYIDQDATIVFSAKPEIATETFTVPILDDDIDEPIETFAVTLSAPVDATIAKSVGVGSIVDNDNAAVTIESDDGIFVVEGGASDSMSVVLQTQPTAVVAVSITAPQEQLVIEPSPVSFDPTNWDEPQLVAITAALDGIDEDDPHQVPILFSVESADLRYQAASPPSILAAVGDADALLVTIDGPSAGATEMSATFNAVVNAGGTGTITYQWAAFLQGNSVATGNQPSFEFTPRAPGAFIIRALVGDEQGQNPAEFIQFTVMSDITASTFARDILWLTSEGITTGCDADGTEFCPDKNVSRAQMAAFLVRFLDLTDDGGGNTFTDDDGSVFEDDIAKIAAAGITAGCNPPVNDRFCPSHEVSRGQLAAFLVRALGLSDDGGGNTFTDDDGSIFEDDIAKIAAAGITAGCNDEGTLFCPEQPATRGQMAAFLRRAAALLSE